MEPAQDNTVGWLLLALQREREREEWFHRSSGMIACNTFHGWMQKVLEWAGLEQGRAAIDLAYKRTKAQRTASSTSPGTSWVAV